MPWFAEKDKIFVYFLVCIVGDVVYGVGETVPSEQPCLKCSCSPPDVRCETEICVTQPGCKAIHRPNKCCPDYQCGKPVHNFTSPNLTFFAILPTLTFPVRYR